MKTISGLYLLAFMAVLKYVTATSPIYCPPPPQPCPANEVFSCTTDLCQATCIDPYLRQCETCNQGPSAGLRKACKCNSGLIRLYNYGPCVPPAQCNAGPTGPTGPTGPPGPQ